MYKILCWITKRKNEQYLFKWYGPKSSGMYKYKYRKNNVDNNVFKVFNLDAAQLMYQNPKFFDVIDLDPYGTTIPFIDSCINCSKNGALLCILIWIRLLFNK